MSSICQVNFLSFILSDFLLLNNRIWSCVLLYCKQYMAASSRISLEQSWWIFNELKSMLDFSHFVRQLGFFSIRLHLYTQCKHQRRLLFSSIIYVWLYGEQCLHKTISKCIVPKLISHAPMSNVLLLSSWFQWRFSIFFSRCTEASLLAYNQDDSVDEMSVDLLNCGRNPNQQPRQTLTLPD